jgi:membrane protease YdiL (CAAX protease family)
LYRYLTSFSDITDEVLAKPVIWLMPLVGLLLIFPKKHLLSIFGIRDLTVRNVLLGIAAGVFLTLLQLIPLALHGFAKISVPPDILVLTLATVGTAFCEEVLFRGFIFRQLSYHYSSLITYPLTSILFAVIHIPYLLQINHYSGIPLLLSLYVIFASSIIFCLVYSYTKNLWVVILAHFVMDFLLLII